MVAYLLFWRIMAVKLDKAEKDALVKIAKIDEILAYRSESDKLSKYNQGEKIHEKQITFHKCQKKNRWVFGGNRSGKTECGAVEAVWWARGIHPYRENRKDVSGWVVSVSYEVQREVAQLKVLSYLKREWIEDVVMQSGKKDSPEYGVIDYIVVKNVFGGLSKIGFKSIDQGREKFQGASLDFVWFDEEPPKDIYEECRMRVLDRKGEIWGTMTPLKGLTWVYDEIFLNKRNSPDVWHEEMEWADNPYLDENEVKSLNDSLSEDSIESRRFGRFNVECGLVYPEFEENVHVIEPFDIPFDWQDTLSIDPGLNNPLSCHFYAIDYDGNIYVVGEHYEAGRDVNYHSEKIFELADKLSWHKDGQGRLKEIIDSASTQRTLSSIKSVAEMFYENGILLNTKVNKDVFTGIARVKEYLKKRKLFIFKNCVNMIREIKSYWWQEGDRVRKVDDHAMDELRYYVMTRPEPRKISYEKNDVERDLDRLMKMNARSRNGR